MLPRIFAQDAIESVIHDPALALARQIVALVDDCARSARHLGRVVSAGVGNDKDVDQLRWIILVADGPYEVGDDGLLVMRRDEEGVAVLLSSTWQLDLAAEKAYQQIHHLIGEADGEQDAQDEVEDYDRCHGSSLRVPMFVQRSVSQQLVAAYL